MLPKDSSIITCRVRLLASTSDTMSISMCRKAADFFERHGRSTPHSKGQARQCFYEGEIMNLRTICLLCTVLLLVGCGRSVKINEAVRKEAETAGNEAPRGCHTE